MYKLKKICISMFLMLIIFSSSITAYTNVTNFNPKYGTLTARTNFRTKPSTSSTVISVLAKGTAVKMIGQSNTFYIVQLGNNQIGYVSKDYVKSSTSAPKGASTYTNMSAKIGTVNANSVNLRRGPGTNFSKVTKLTKGTSVKVIGSIGNFYTTITKDNTVGMMHKDYISFNSNNSNTNTSNQTTSSNLGNQDEQYVLKLINDYRIKNNVPKLTMGTKLINIAGIKADDMTKKNYFSHTSPTYGSPFDMMKNYGLSYKVAGENIAGNPSLEGAVNSWINSSTHRENLLSTSYNYVGIGISKSSTYGYIVVAMFAGV